MSDDLISKFLIFISIILITFVVLAAGVKYLTENSLKLVDSTESKICQVYANNSHNNVSRIEINNQSFSLNYLEQICINKKERLLN
jgi:hypothetical protein